MKDLIKQLMANWLKVKFRNNPIITNPSDYLGKVAAAVQVGMIGTVALIGVTMLAISGFTVGVLRGWF